MRGALRSSQMLLPYRTQPPAGVRAHQGDRAPHQHPLRDWGVGGSQRQQHPQRAVLSRQRVQAEGCREGACGAPANAPLRLERYVGWNLNTGCEVQRKRTGGGGAERKERARPGQFQYH